MKRGTFNLNFLDQGVTGCRNDLVYTSANSIELPRKSQTKEEIEENFLDERKSPRVGPTSEGQAIGVSLMHWKEHAIAEGGRAFEQLSNPKVYGTAIYALTRKTRIHRERRILGFACIYTS